MNNKPTVQSPANLPVKCRNCYWDC